MIGCGCVSLKIGGAGIWPKGHDLLTPDLDNQQYLYIDIDFLLEKKSFIAVFSN